MADKIPLAVTAASSLASYLGQRAAQGFGSQSSQSSSQQPSQQMSQQQMIDETNRRIAVRQEEQKSLADQQLANYIRQRNEDAKIQESTAQIIDKRRPPELQDEEIIYQSSTSQPAQPIQDNQASLPPVDMEEQVVEGNPIVEELMQDPELQQLFNHEVYQNVFPEDQNPPAEEQQNWSLFIQQMRFYYPGQYTLETTRDFYNKWKEYKLAAKRDDFLKSVQERTQDMRPEELDEFIEQNLKSIPSQCQWFIQKDRYGQQRIEIRCNYQHQKKIYQIR